MAMRQRTVTGTLIDASGAAIANATIEFNLTSAVSATLNFVYIDRPFTVATNASGYFSIALWCDEDGLIPTDYRVTFPKANLGSPDSGHARVFSLVYDTTPVDLGTLISMSQPVVDPELLLYSQIDARISSGILRGSTTLAAGTKAVTLTGVTAASIIMLSRKTAGGTIGHLSVSAQGTGTFTITSSSATETSTINYLVLNP